MGKRVSLKGKGAELFFGDESSAAAPLPAPSPSPADHPQVPQQPPSAHPQVSKHARLQARTQASVHPRVQASPTPVNLTDLLPAIYDQLAARATVSNAFRYTASELERLTDALYQLTKKHRVKLTKQDVARLGLNAVLLDHETRGKDSLLTQLALRKKREPGGDV